MKRIVFILPILAVLTIILSCQSDRSKVSDKDLESGFITPPDSIQTGVYWY
jgi:hypothetical protein